MMYFKTFDVINENKQMCVCDFVFTRGNKFTKKYENICHGRLCQIELINQI